MTCTAQERQKLFQLIANDERFSAHRAAVSLVTADHSIRAAPVNGVFSALLSLVPTEKPMTAEIIE
jgi:hypothetical protein